VTVPGDELRAAMRRFPSGVAVVTAAAGGARVGVTVGSLVSLSLEPPLVGISIGVHSASHLLLREAGRFVVNVLAGDQERLAWHFAAGVPPLALWQGVATRQGELPEPLLDGALAWLECRVEAEHPVGDHALFVASVLSTELGREAPGLVYVHGAYREAA
jgi:flavin reductase (DIM6/NTAB) family NADH-FMN oxidoreductase RutF